MDPIFFKNFNGTFSFLKSIKPKNLFFIKKRFRITFLMSLEPKLQPVVPGGRKDIISTPESYQFLE